MTVSNRIALPSAGHTTLRIEFPPEAGPSDRVHLLDAASIHAVNAALAAGRPLLVRGEPGTGKSQLARAAACRLGRVLVTHVVDSHTESRDLLWTFDAVKRLADAQIAGALRTDGKTALAEMAVANYLHPGPLWWAFDWAEAHRQAKKVGAVPPVQRDGGDWANGAVVLLDEIDKAESEVPNGLLEALGAREFTPLGRATPVQSANTPPLVVITTNEERALPDAFLRRCMVLFLNLPEEDADLVAFLTDRGEAHFPETTDTIRRKAAEMLAVDRRAAKEAQIRPFPGQAEYLDLLRAVTILEPDDADAQAALLEIVRPYTLQKHSGL